MKKKINEITNFTLESQLQDTIERNYRKSYGESFKQREDRLKRSKRKEQILTALIIIFILVTTCMLLI